MVEITLENADLLAGEQAFGDLPKLLTAIACAGIAWFLCAELNVRLLVFATRRSLYFWSCLICSWAIIAHLVMIILSNFKVWDSYSSIPFIHITWFTFVVSQSIVLYSRLNLVLKKENIRRYVLYMIVINSVCFGLTTVVLGMIARYPTNATRLENANKTWDKVQLTVFFVQETIISILYICETIPHLKNARILGSDPKVTKKILHHLIYVNIFIIGLDCSLIGLCFARLFWLQGYYKAAVYAIKLRTEFLILNQLRSALPGASTNGSHYTSSRARSGNRPPQTRTTQPRHVIGSQDSEVEMVNMEEQVEDVERGSSSRSMKDWNFDSSKEKDNHITVRTIE